jgi:hypothetical protein
MEKYRLHEILGFIYYKIGLIVKILLAAVAAKMFRPDKKIHIISTCLPSRDRQVITNSFLH